MREKKRDFYPAGTAFRINNLTLISLNLFQFYPGHRLENQLDFWQQKGSRNSERPCGRKKKEGRNGGFDAACDSSASQSMSRKS